MGFLAYSIGPKNSKALIGLVCGILFVAAISTVYFYKPTYNILNSKEFVTKGFSDVWNQGNSEIKLDDLDSTHIKFSYRLGNKALYPFAGILTEKNDSSFFSLKGYVMELTIHSITKGRLPVRVYSFQKGVSDSANINSYRIYEKVFPLTEGKNKITIRFDEMRSTPEWWYAMNQVTAESVGDQDLGFVRHLSLFSDPNIKAGDQRTLKIKKWKITPDYHDCLKINLITTLSFLSIFLLISYGKYMKLSKVQLVLKKEEDFNYNDTSDKELVVKLKMFLAQHYTNSELKSSDLAKFLSVPEYKIGDLFNKTIGMSFKSYLNNVRIESAKKYLETSEYNISEIAYKVGFNSPQSFNRVFKEIENVSPTEYRSS